MLATEGLPSGYRGVRLSPEWGGLPACPTIVQIIVACPLSMFALAAVREIPRIRLAEAHPELRSLYPSELKEQLDRG
jgi:hypothetical protein